MRSYQEGNSAAFEALYKRHSGRVYGYLMVKLRDRSKADDVFQLTFLKLHQSRLRYDDSLPFVPWLFTISQSVLVDWFRKSKTIREDLNEAFIHQQAAVAPVNLATSSDIDLGLLEGAQKTAVELRYGEDFSFQEIARRLETSPSNVRQLVSRGIKKLRSAIQESEG